MSVPVVRQLSTFNAALDAIRLTVATVADMACKNLPAVPALTVSVAVCALRTRVLRAMKEGVGQHKGILFSV